MSTPSSSSPAQSTSKDAGNPWDKRFAGQDYVYGRQPNEFLTRQRYRLTDGGAVLVPGDGEGRNGVWLARQGMKVASVDGSPVGLQKAMKLALDQGVTLRTICADLTDWDWPVEAYDAVVVVFLHFPSSVRQSVHAAMVRALKPGGLLLMEAFHPDQLGRGSGGPPSIDLLYTPEMLRDDFAHLDILQLDVVTAALDEGALHQGEAVTCQLVAQKPL